MPSAKEIAAKLGLSTSAVSIAMNNRPGISDETRALILNTAREMGYYHTPRKSTAGGNIRLLIITQDIQTVLDCNSFIDRLVEGVSVQSRSMNYNLQICYIKEEDLNAKNLEDFADENCRGIILMASVCEGIPEIFVKNNKIPVVILDKPADYCGLDCVTASNRNGIVKVVDHLYELGHRNIAFVGGASENSNSAERRSAYWHAVRRHEDSFKSCDNIFIINYNRLDGATPEIIDRMIASGNMPTAIVCATDFTAISVMKALTSRGYNIPGDVSVVGYDNLPVGNACTPALTTVDVPKKRMGALAVMRLNDIITGSSREKVRIEILADLLVRESTGPAKN